MATMMDLTNEQKLEVELEIQGAIARFPVGFNKLTHYLSMVRSWDPAKAHFYHYAIMTHLGNQLKIMNDQCAEIDELKLRYEEGQEVPVKGKALLNVLDLSRKKSNDDYN